ncbi:response regulator transcription factor [Balneolaceae bacterium YR4-1]|uniref:Response regulator transcription factor n=1 Tax=Halalkalibaculum roseum TaxID=2709311 RepID=A0A6M1SWJ4_9BACT|nr:response regulator transcription factor [Halalkalibaculum roseum]
MGCLVVDDEPSAQEVLKQYIADTPQLFLKGCCEDALAASEFLANNNVDLLFLDVNMPKLSGISFLKSQSEVPPVILTTAYDDYALEGYELDVLDYLLKPFSFERFLKAVQKLDKHADSSNEDTSVLTIRADKKTYRIATQDIRYIESAGDYVTIHTTEQRLTTYETLKNMESKLPADDFIRVHKSYIIAVSSIEYLEGNSVRVGDQFIPIGTTYRETVKQFFSE